MDNTFLVKYIEKLDNLAHAMACVESNTIAGIRGTKSLTYIETVGFEKLHSDFDLKYGAFIEALDHLRTDISNEK